MTSLDARPVLGQLKDFQRATVEYVHHRLWIDNPPARRFLVADEVGLGKTMVAKGLIAKALEHLSTADRVDIVYICSNSQIARQNISRLNITGQDLNHADRLTLLSRQIHRIKQNRVNVVSFTPGTSFNIGESSGRVEERALIFAMLRRVWGRHSVSSTAWKKFFMDTASEASFDREVAKLGHNDIDDEVAGYLVREVESVQFGDSPEMMSDALYETVARFRYLREGSTVDRSVSRRRAHLIGQMRSMIASAAIESLDPKLVILDEFQRFKALLDPTSPGATLAQMLLNHPTARVLLLSATPYKMYTLPDEPEGEDHYEDFEATVRFLAGDGPARQVGRDLAAMRHGIFDPRARESALVARDRAEATLRQYISRTERLASTPDRDGMLREIGQVVSLDASDVHAFRTSQAVSDIVGSGDVIEYWRSTPYVLNLMDNYKLKRDVTVALGRNDAGLRDALANGHGLLDWTEIEQYRRLDPGNAKMRALVKDVIDRDAWRLVWLPPSLPYYGLGGPYTKPALASFTKRLVFSAWNVVPKAIATMMSYEAERASAKRSDPSRTYGDRPSPLLNFARSADRLVGMPVLALLYPSVALARLGDPLALARDAQELPLPLARIQGTLRSHVESALEALPPGDALGTVDQRWYWAAPFLLDKQSGMAQDKFLHDMLRWGNAGDDDASSAQHDHIEQAVRISASDLGRRPDDLVHVIAMMALAGPGVVALRALSRIAPDRSLDDPALRWSAADISWALRSLFNQPYVMDNIRAGGKETRYWAAVLQHCVDGCLQAVLDEYVHVLIESEGQQDKPSLERAATVAEAIASAMGLRGTNNLVDDIRVHDDGVIVTRRPLAVHFAVRFGRDAADTEKVVNREGAVREAFNSPFWPFVLASTSVGQEGLDFHQYSHAVVHWNLPGNPVDLEQREGRVHRYKNHAVRKNVAQAHAHAVLDPAVRDPWSAMFEAAQRARPDGANDLFPFWLFPREDGAYIERYVLALPLSRESARFRRLQRTVGAYRLAFGQPRQEDLLRYAAAEGVDLTWAAIDLSPPPFVPPRHTASASAVTPSGAALTTNERALDVVVAELERRGVHATLERSGRRTEIRVDLPQGPRWLQVKSRTGGDWQTSTEYGRPREVKPITARFWVLVDFIPGDPELYVVPEWWIQNDIYVHSQRYLARHAGHRAINDESTHHRIETSRVTPWRDRWDLILLPNPISPTPPEASLDMNDTVVVAAREAWPEYQRHSSYVCQPNRSFRVGLTHLGFYADGAVQPLIPRIRTHCRAVRFTREEADAQRRKGARELGDLIDKLLDEGPRTVGNEYDVFLLSSPSSADTVRLRAPIENDTVTTSGRPWGWTLGQRYTQLSALMTGPAFTSDI